MIRRARRRMVTSGMAKSGHVARGLAATMSSTGTPAIFVHPAEAGHSDLGMITPDDVIMALSWSGRRSRAQKNLIDFSRRFRIGLIAMTSEGASTLAQAADVALVLPQARGMSAQSRAHDLLADATRSGPRPCDRPVGKPWLHAARFSHSASGRAAGPQRSRSPAT
ncbi:MAG: SIS domain-containing protein [Xanthobacteraceae bacterium]